MSTPITETFIASGTIREYRAVSIDGNGKVSESLIGTDKAIVGIAQRAVTAGDPVDVVISGKTRAIAGNNITASTEPRLKVVTANGGKLEDVAAGDFAVCRMIPNTNQTSAVDNDQIWVLFIGPTIVHA